MPFTRYHDLYSLISASTEPIGRFPYSVDE
jgi:hypothetical protein